MLDKKSYIRVWSAFDVNEIKRHLLLIDDLYGSCANCKQLGLNYLKDKECPGCKTVFKYIATNLKGIEDVKKILNRIQDMNLQLTLIEKEDYIHSTAKDAVKDLFKN
ncbi:MAG TPA: hypothetical protein PK079_26205 [Leptospiraceae bacterium]|nr:hypothetical protein [Leptospiraceae bacterium]HMW04535.1 hypothetical protein [Leptospiraceae bacterium]HMX34332.1 hypothetical protein [Leptospiraceae bacterium]HMY30721.1 hypothetical protein [Leptospiraceae bacterium]HMZ64299.1 hypothetical protein [Leptospiraceae bacterium]